MLTGTTLLTAAGTFAATYFADGPILNHLHITPKIEHSPLFIPVMIALSALWHVGIPALLIHCTNQNLTRFIHGLDKKVSQARKIVRIALDSEAYKGIDDRSSYKSITITDRDGNYIGDISGALYSFASPGYVRRLAKNQTAAAKHGNIADVLLRASNAPPTTDPKELLRANKTGVIETRPEELLRPGGPPPSPQ